MYYIYSSFYENKLNYLHLFEGSTKDRDGYSIISKSLFRFAKPKTHITPVGGKLFIGSRNASENLSDLIKTLIVGFFELDLSPESIVL